MPYNLQVRLMNDLRIQNVARKRYKDFFLRFSTHKKLFSFTESIRKQFFKDLEKTFTSKEDYEKALTTIKSKEKEDIRVMKKEVKVRGSKFSVYLKD